MTEETLGSASQTPFPHFSGDNPRVSTVTVHSEPAGTLYSIVSLEMSDTLLPERIKNFMWQRDRHRRGCFIQFKDPSELTAKTAELKWHLIGAARQHRSNQSRAFKRSVLILSFPCWRHHTKRRDKESDKRVPIRPLELASLRGFDKQRANPFSRDLLSDTKCTLLFSFFILILLYHTFRKCQ